ncbi:MAG TPA: hypothetical protein VLK32_00930 [Bacillota bacterium]|nr:hypothetical protein [Bacillota bacterium]
MTGLLDRLAGWLDALPRMPVVVAIAGIGAIAGYIALAGLRWDRAPSGEPAVRPPGRREALAELIRAAETSPTARRVLAARLREVAAAFRAAPPALDAVLQTCPGVPAREYRARLAQALDELEARAEGGRR